MRAFHKTFLALSRSSITGLFKISTGFHLGILCLSLAGVLTYCFSVFLGFTSISNQIIIFWLIMGTFLTVLAWRRFRNLLFDGATIKQKSVVHEFAIVVISIISIVIAIKASYSQTLFVSGDFVSFLRLTTQFTEFRGPWSFGALPFEYISPDRIHLNRSAGPFYPQATHFIVAMTNNTLGLNDLPRTTRLLTFLLCFSVLPLLLVLLGRSFQRRSNFSVLISFSLLFSILLVYDLKSGQIPAAIATTLMIFLLVFSMSLTSVKQRIISMVLGILILALAHPSAAASYFLLYTLTLDWRLKPSLFSISLKKISMIHQKHPALIPATFFVFLVGIVAVSDKVASYIRLWSGFHKNPEFDPTLGLEIIVTALRFVFVNFFLFGNFSAIHLVVVILISVCILFFGLNLRNGICFPELLIVLIVLSSSLGGSTGLLSFAALPSILWYSTPLRVVHLWTILVFIRLCKGKESRNTSSGLLLTTVLLATAVHAIHLFSSIY
jgi:hypothetical protein